jgi:two-component system KDP operon response regulator KdpE
MSKKTIIICDDNDPLVLVMSQVLGRHGYNVMTAGDGREGLDLARKSAPDLLLLDLEMPSLDGLGVLRGLGELAGKRPYTVVLSAHEGPEKRKEVLDLGAHEFWGKPFNAASLLSRIEALITEGLI